MRYATVTLTRDTRPATAYPPHGSSAHAAALEAAARNRTAGRWSFADRTARAHVRRAQDIRRHNRWETAPATLPASARQHVAEVRLSGGVWTVQTGPTGLEVYATDRAREALQVARAINRHRERHTWTASPRRRHIADDDRPRVNADRESRRRAGIH